MRAATGAQTWDSATQRDLIREDHHWTLLGFIGPDGPDPWGPLLAPTSDSPTRTGLSVKPTRVPPQMGSTSLILENHQSAPQMGSGSLIREGRHWTPNLGFSNPDGPDP